jgi:hypothetical protein
MPEAATKADDRTKTKNPTPNYSLPFAYQHYPTFFSFKPPSSIFA